MKKLIVIIALGCATLAGDAVVYPPQARCAFCPTHTCYGPGACGQCRCVKPAGELYGSCMDIE